MEPSTVLSNTAWTFFDFVFWPFTYCTSVYW